jgi:homoserine dehydrogenase
MQAVLQTQPIFLLGFGGVGRALLRQLIAARAIHTQRRNLKLNVVGISDSSGVFFDTHGLADARLQNLLDRKAKGEIVIDIGQTLDDVVSLLPARTIIVDTTATDRVVPFMLKAKQLGHGVVLANKLPLAGDIAWWDALTQGPARWETTCGSAMPVISTLTTLLDAGDNVMKIEGSLSGTLAFLASQLEAGKPFGDAVREAKQKGYTEPDPRQDLGGRDAGRKALILARMLGYRIGMEDVSIESLYPANLDGVSIDGFLREIDVLNVPMAQRASALCEGGKKLRYAAVIEIGKCELKLVGAEPNTKMGAIQASDSIVVFTTSHFSNNPLAVSGRGAGQEVTAMGVLGDIVSLAKSF